MSEVTELATAIAGAINGAKPAPVSVEQTSIDAYSPSEVTVRFRKWSAFNGTAYQRGQQAGFSRSQVADLVRTGRAEIVELQERDVAPGLRRSVIK